MGDVIMTNSRRQAGQMEVRGNNQVVPANVPLSEMFGYSTDLRSKTRSRYLHDAARQLQADAGQRAGRNRHGSGASDPNPG